MAEDTPEQPDETPATVTEPSPGDAPPEAADDAEAPQPSSPAPPRRRLIAPPGSKLR